MNMIPVAGVLQYVAQHYHDYHPVTETVHKQAKTPVSDFYLKA
jgi:hypothetical protein